MVRIAAGREKPRADRRFLSHPAALIRASALVAGPKCIGSHPRDVFGTEHGMDQRRTCIAEPAYTGPHPGAGNPRIVPDRTGRPDPARRLLSPESPQSAKLYCLS